MSADVPNTTCAKDERALMAAVLAGWKRRIASLSGNDRQGLHYGGEGGKRGKLLGPGDQKLGERH